MYRRIFLIATALLITLISSSCASQDAPTNGDKIMLTYQRSGGIAGFLDELTIYYNGRTEAKRIGSEAEFTLTNTELEGLKTLIEQANFLKLNANYLPGSPIADAFEYAITYYTQDGERHTVKTMTTAIPDVLGPLINELNEIVTRQS